MSGFVFGDIFNDTETVSAKEALSTENDFSFKGVFGVVDTKNDRIRVGGIVRVTPFAFHMLSDASVVALGRNLNELGITDAIPKAYKNRLKKNIEKGLVSKDGGSFTEKGTEIATKHLIRNGYSVEKAKKKAQTAKAWKHDENRVEALGEKIEKLKQANLKFAFGYRLDQKGQTFAEQKAITPPMKTMASSSFPTTPFAKPMTTQAGGNPSSIFSILENKDKPL